MARSTSKKPTKEGQKQNPEAAVGGDAQSGQESGAGDRPPAPDGAAGSQPAASSSGAAEPESAGGGRAPAGGEGEGGGDGDAGSASKSSSKGAAPTHIRITSSLEGFRRAGMAHSKTPTDHPIGTFTAAQIEALKREPRLMVELVTLPD